MLSSTSSSAHAARARCSTFPTTGTTDTASQTLTATGSTQAATAATVSGLNPTITTTYCFRLCASAPGYALECDGIQTFTLSRTGTTTPAATTLPATAVTPTGATLNGQVTDYPASTTVATRYNWGP